MKTTAILSQKVRRSPASLAGYWYTLNPGTLVYVHDEKGPGLLCSTLDEPEISEDFFRIRPEGVSASALSL